MKGEKVVLVLVRSTCFCSITQPSSRAVIIKLKHFTTQPPYETISEYDTIKPSPLMRTKENLP